MAYRKLGRNSSNRKALFRSILSSFFKHERIETTVTKAKEVSKHAAKLITLAKYADRQGGFTRIYKVGPRRGDAAEMAIIELI